MAGCDAVEDGVGHNAGVAFGTSKPASMSVSIPPGYTPCTAMPRWRSPGRIAWVYECRAAFDAE